MADTDEGQEFNPPSLGSEADICRICSTTTSEEHFGVNSCRACAAFFRRSVTANRKYICRRGNNKCNIHKSVRCICRKCRFQRCLEAGMCPKGFSLKALGIKSAKKFKDEDVEEIIDEPSTSKDEKLNVSIAHPILIVPSEPCKRVSVIQTPDQPGLLLKVKTGYNNMCSVRRATEMAMTNSSMRDMFLGGAGERQQSLSNYRIHDPLEKAFLPTIADFLYNTFEEYREFDENEKWVIYQNCVIIMQCLDTAYITATKVPAEMFGKRYFMTLTTYVDSDKLEDFFLGEDFKDKIICIKLMDLIFTGCRMKLSIQLRDAKLADEEYIALLILTMWHSNLENASIRVNDLAARLRKEVYRQLHLYYNSIGMQNYAERMGEVLNLVGSIFICAATYRENFELGNLNLDLLDNPLFRIVRNERPPKF